jgi:hypothetical protein
VAECRAERSLVEECARVDVRLTEVRAEQAQYLAGPTVFGAAPGYHRSESGTIDPRS